MADKNWYDIDEASIAAMGKGFQLPIGGRAGKKKNNPSKPFGESEIFEGVAVGPDEEIEERIEKVGDEWVIIDPRTGAQVDKAPTRDAAREKQASLGITQKRDASSAATTPGATAGLDATKKNQTTVKQRKPSGVKKMEGLKDSFRQALRKSGMKVVRESSMLSYMFEDAITPDVNLWETAIKKLPRNIVMGDDGLREILEGIAKAEARTLARAVVEIKRVLESTGPFLVEREKADQDPETGDIRMPFKVKISTNGDPEPDKDLLFGVKLEGGKPCVLFPTESREALNNMLTTESKLLRAELMHVQETVLDRIEDVLEATSLRDNYLSEMHLRLNEALGGFSLIETVILKNLIKDRLKGAK